MISTFYISGMDCPSCARKVEEHLRRERSVQAANIEFISRKLTVDYNEELIDRRGIASKVESLGYTVSSDLPGAERHGFKGMKDWASFALSGIFTAAGLLLHFLSGETVYPTVLYIAAIFSGAVAVVPKALQSAKSLSFDIHLLMSIAIAGAAAIGEWPEAAVAISLFSLANLLEAGSLSRADTAIKSLMELAPGTALIKDRNGQSRKLVSEVSAGEIFVLKPGDTVPLDGKVISGSSDVNEAPVTGESRASDKEAGDNVYAGSINGDGMLEVEVTRTADQTALAGIIRTVEKAKAEKGMLERKIDSFAGYYTPAVIVIAVLTALVPPLAGLGSFKEWFYNGLVILVVSCPCALIISTPVAVLSGLTRAARLGVLVKGGSFLEWAGKIKVIAFDKTGTLTEGKPAVKSVHAVKNISIKELVGIAASVESGSEHKIAGAIIGKAAELGAELTPVSGFRAIKGKGAEAVLDGRKFVLGNHLFVCGSGLCDGSIHPDLEKIDNEALTTVLLADEKEVLAIFTVSDKIRQGAAEVMAALSGQGISTIMLTGDTAGSAKEVSETIGMTAFRAGMLPEDKAVAIRELISEKGLCAMAGDGINDAPAMAEAHIGISMGTIGTGLAVETSDVMLLGDDLSGIPKLVSLSRSVNRIIAQNIFFSFAVKLAVLALAMTGNASLWMAVAADVGSSVAVIFNSLRVLGK